MNDESPLPLSSNSCPINTNENHHEHGCSHAPDWVAPLLKHIDFLGVGASSLCAVHCILMPFIITGLSMIGVRHLVQHDATHAMLAGFVIFCCFIAIIPGYRRHGNKIIVATMFVGISLVMFATFYAESVLGEAAEFPIISLGNVLVITAHLLNRKHMKLVATLPAIQATT